MEELNKKLAEWAGFDACYKSVAPEETGVEYWVQPPDSEKTIPLPDFTQSLDACFKWLVPKLGQVNIEIDQTFTTEYPQAEVTITDYSGEALGVHSYWQARAETPALALCLAIEKLIDGINK